jgi:hypothetical protein
VFAVVAALVALACVLASARRLVFVAELTALDPALLERALQKGTSVPALAAAVASEPKAGWERALFDAASAPPEERVARVNEVLSDLDYAAQRWARVPRACASIASSTGFLFASLALRAALVDETADIDAAVLGAVGIVVTGIAGAVFCIAANVRAGALMKERLKAVDRLVDRLERLADRPTSAPVSDGLAASGVETRPHPARADGVGGLASRG